MQKLRVYFVDEVYMLIIQKLQIVLNTDNTQRLQTDVNNVVEWFNKNFLSINVLRCKIVSFGRNIDNSNTFDVNGNPIR